MDEKKVEKEGKYCRKKTKSEESRRMRRRDEKNEKWARKKGREEGMT